MKDHGCLWEGFPGFIPRRAQHSSFLPGFLLLRRTNYMECLSGFPLFCKISPSSSRGPESSCSTVIIGGLPHLLVRPARLSAVQRALESRQVRAPTREQLCGSFLAPDEGAGFFGSMVFHSRWHDDCVCRPSDACRTNAKGPPPVPPVRHNRRHAYHRRRIEAIRSRTPFSPGPALSDMDGRASFRIRTSC